MLLHLSRAIWQEVVRSSSRHVASLQATTTRTATVVQPWPHQDSKCLTTQGRFVSCESVFLNSAQRQPSQAWAASSGSVFSQTPPSRLRKRARLTMLIPAFATEDVNLS